MDDFILMAEPCRINIHKETLLHLLANLRFHVNLEKNSLVPQEGVNYLGFTIIGKARDGQSWINVPTENNSHIKAGHTACTKTYQSQGQRFSKNNKSVHKYCQGNIASKASTQKCLSFVRTKSVMGQCVRIYIL